MRKLLAIVATLALMLFGAGAALADPPEDPPCDAGNAGQHNPNFDEDDIVEAEDGIVQGDAAEEDVEEQAALLFAWLAEQFELSTP